MVSHLSGRFFPMNERINKPDLSAGVRLLIVDEHGLHRAGTRMLFHGVWFVDEVATAGTAEEAVEVARKFCPHVTLMDLAIPSPGPFHSARGIMSQGSDSRVIFLDERFRRFHLRKALDVGASGYWTKHATFDEACEAVRRVAAGQTTFCHRAHRHLQETPLGMHFKPSESESSIDHLTPREVEVVQHLGEGFTVKQCAEKMGLSPSTIENHKTRIMKKLQVTNVVQLVRLANREGLLWQADSQ